MRPSNATFVLVLVLLFAGQTVMAVASQCRQVQDVPRDCCCETPHRSTIVDCGCYHLPAEPQPAPAAYAQTPELVATPTSATDTAPEADPWRTVAVDAADLPPTPPLRAHNVRAPPSFK